MAYSPATEVHSPDSSTSGVPLLSMDVLPVVLGFHTGDMRTYDIGRFPEGYIHCIDRFESLLGDVDEMLGRPRTCFDVSIAYRYRLAKELPLLCAKYDAYATDNATDAECPFRDALVQLQSIFHRLSKDENVEPKFQVVSIENLPPEIVAMVVSCATRGSVFHLSNVAGRYRDICRSRLMEVAKFVMRADRGLFARTARIDRDFLNDVYDAMVDSRVECEGSIYDFLSEDFYRDRVRTLLFRNDWEEHFRADGTWDLPSPLTDFIFGELHDAVDAVLGATSPVHVAFRSLGILPRTLSAISRHRHLRTLSIEDCFSSLPSPSSMRALMGNIVSLELGFGLSPHNSGQCRDTWLIAAYCPQLRHLYAYPASPTAVVHWPVACYTELSIIHQLDTLHLQGMDTSTTFLQSWITHAATIHAGRCSRLSAFKLHTFSGMNHMQSTRVLRALTLLAGSLRILVIDGINHVPSRFLRRIGWNLPLLEGLSLFRRMGRFASRTQLVPWEEPLSAYANELSFARHIRHFEANFEWSRYTYSPAVLDVLLSAGAGDAAPPLEPRERVTSFLNTDQQVVGVDDYLMDDGWSVALPFAISCPSLQSFAITADFTFFSCTITRSTSGGYSFENVRDDVYARFDDRWNPFIGRTWRTV